jgi:hypothetical protein
MSESFRERIKQNEQLINKLTDYEKSHELEWCPISDEMLKEMYPGECNSQEDRDRKVDTMPIDELEILLDATLQRYRKLKKRKEEEGQQQHQTQEEEEYHEQKEEEEATITQ